MGKSQFRSLHENLFIIVEDTYQIDIDRSVTILPILRFVIASQGAFDGLGGVEHLEGFQR